MRKVFVAARTCDRNQLIDRIRDLGVIHLTPVNPDRAVADEKTGSQINNMERAIQVLRSITPRGPVPAISPVEAAQAVLDIQHRSAERRNRLTDLHRQIEQLGPWGNVQLETFKQLREAGVDVRFYSVPIDEVNLIEAECVEVVGSLAGKRSLVAVIDRHGQPRLPDEAKDIPLPHRDAPSIRAEAAEIDAGLKQDADFLTELAHLATRMETALTELRQQADFSMALRSGSEGEHLFAIQGWIPAEKSDSLKAELAGGDLKAAVQIMDPDLVEEEPPTLIRYPNWSRPIEGLFKILGTVPGYREFDVSSAFMIALPVFAAMLISDGGYGAVLLLAPLLLYKKVSATLGERFTQLIITIGAFSVLWGFLCGSFFGCTLYPPPLPVDLSDQSRSILMKLSFVLGAIHLCVAKIWQAMALYPNPRFLNPIGWGIFIWGMLGVVLFFVLGSSMAWNTPWPYLLIIGGTMTIFFACPSRNVLRMLTQGLADFPLSLLSAFSDVISYVRLMAVGLASSVLAVSFNDMAREAGIWPLTLAILVFGHGLNLALAMIALFAHGVRLNMLEFSSNLGMQWTGYPYNPFLKQSVEEH